MKYIFRAWYKDEPYKFTQRVINDEIVFIMKDIYVYKYPFYIPFVDSDWTVEQFTGIYDSTTWEELTEQEREEWVYWGNMPSEWKGKMIFEGDILHGWEHYPVTYCGDMEGGLGMEMGWYLQRDNFESFTQLVSDTTYKIIGNIHENKELLKL